MKLKVAQKTELVLAFTLFLLCCIISFVQSNVGDTEIVTTSVTTLIGG
ncbi:MAG: hypothetical protein HC912_00395 [Saprospiraceae bacterium]|nr:hypothetical protein [Saprospiraceae bacterium]